MCLVSQPPKTSSCISRILVQTRARAASKAGNNCQMQASKRCVQPRVWQKPRSRGEIGSWPRQTHASALSVHPSSANLLVDLPLTTVAAVLYTGRHITYGAHIASCRQHTFAQRHGGAELPLSSRPSARLGGLHNKNEEGA